jgi:hypothetical protein
LAEARFAAAVEDVVEFARLAVGAGWEIEDARQGLLA